MTLSVDIARDYAPWTAEFTDGTFASRLNDPQLTYAQGVAGKESLLYTFYIHLDWRLVVAVRLSDGMFYRGPQLGAASGWFPHPEHVPGLQYCVVYSRQCEAEFCGGVVRGRVKSYTLGWRAEGRVRTMQIQPNGDFTWKRFGG